MAANEIVIERCVFRVRRRGGWTWGADRQTLIERYTRLLPALLEARLSELLGDAEGQIETPVVLNIPLPTGVLPSADHLADQIATALSPADLLPLLDHSPTGNPQRSAVGMTADDQAAIFEAAEASVMPPPANPLLSLLLGWYEQGDLHTRLQSFGAAAATRWLRALVQELPQPISPRSPIELARQGRALLTRLDQATDTLTEPPQRGLYLVVALAARYPGRLGPVSLGHLLAFLLPAADPASRSANEVPAPATPAKSADSPEPVYDAPGMLDSGSRVGSGSPASVDLPVERQDEIALQSVLPFLVLGVLQRIGYLEVLRAALKVVDSAGTRSAAALATALACKLLPPPRRGWHYPRGVQRTAQAFAGVRCAGDAQGPAQLTTFARAAMTGLSPLNDYVVTELASGHDPAQPLLITGSQSDVFPWLLVDGDGGFPVTWQSGPEGLLNRLDRFGPAPVLVDAACATPDLMTALDQRQRPWLTDTPPGRHEHWRRLPGASRYWIASHTNAHRQLRSLAGRLEPMRRRAAGLSDALLVQRPLAPEPDAAVQALSRLTALAAATGLGMMAWLLWGQPAVSGDDRPAKERAELDTDPLLALERFGDLDGHLRHRADRVEVRLAVGRRYLELKTADLLRDIPAVPWLDHRPVTFPGP